MILFGIFITICMCGCGIALLGLLVILLSTLFSVSNYDRMEDIGSVFTLTGSVISIVSIFIVMVLILFGKV